MVPGTLLELVRNAESQITPDLQTRNSEGRPSSLYFDKALADDLGAYSGLRIFAFSFQNRWDLGLTRKWSPGS